MDRPLKKRLMISSVLVPVSIYAMVFAPFWFFIGIVEIFGLLALNEYLNLAAKKNLVINRPLALAFGAAMPISIHYGAQSAMLALACLAVFVSNFRPKFRDQALTSTALTVFGTLYINWFFGHLIKIKALPYGSAWAFYVILLVKGGDAGAYFIGKKYGRVKLIEHISPNKSVEGAIGGFVTTVLLSVISKIYLPSASFVNLLILGALLGVLSQIGDLAESLIKREVGVKDSGEMPGLGGVLDVLDSLLLTIPVAYYYIYAFIR